MSSKTPIMCEFLLNDNIGSSRVGFVIKLAVC